MLKNVFNKKTSIKSIAAYLYDHQILLIAQHQVKNGFWIATNNYEVLDIETPSEVLGQKNMEIAESSKQNVKNPKTKEEFKEIEKIQLKAGNFKTKKAAQLGKYCNITIENEFIKISPTINKGSKGHQYFNSDRALSIHSKNKEVGDALRLGWKSCL